MYLLIKRDWLPQALHSTRPKSLLLKQTICMVLVSICKGKRDRKLLRSLWQETIAKNKHSIKTTSPTRPRTFLLIKSTRIGWHRQWTTFTVPLGSPCSRKRRFRKAVIEKREWTDLALELSPEAKQLTIEFPRWEKCLTTNKTLVIRATRTRAASLNATLPLIRGNQSRIEIVRWGSTERMGTHTRIKTIIHFERRK
jgi:hypothetical protein